MVVLPAGAIVLLVLAIIHKLHQAAEPLSGTYVHPLISAAVLLATLIMVVGLVVRSAAGRRARAALETRIFEKIPGYRLLKALTGDAVPLAGQGGQRPRPALAQIEEGLCPALVMETFPDGRLLVFVPSSPAPMSGSLYIVTPDRMQLLDVPLMPFMRAVSFCHARRLILGAWDARSARDSWAGRPASGASAAR